MSYHNEITGMWICYKKEEIYERLVKEGKIAEKPKPSENEIQNLKEEE